MLPSGPAPNNTRAELRPRLKHKFALAWNICAHGAGYWPCKWALSSEGCKALFRGAHCQPYLTDQSAEGKSTSASRLSARPAMLRFTCFLDAAAGLHACMHALRASYSNRVQALSCKLRKKIACMHCSHPSIHSCIGRAVITSAVHPAVHSCMHAAHTIPMPCRAVVPPFERIPQFAHTCF